MNLKYATIGLLALCAISCDSHKKNKSDHSTYPDVMVVGAMKDVMWNGKLGSKIDLDTVSDTSGLYGLGPESCLSGEILIMDGTGYVSKVTSDSTMKVIKTLKTSAPFFVYARVKECDEVDLPDSVKNIQDLERLIDDRTKELKRPFAFKLEGRAAKALIHIVNLPKGSVVSSPKEAHRGQINYLVENANVTIIGFFSTEHKAIFTHHDSFMHMHLITQDESQMGHLDDLEIGSMKLYLPHK